MKQHITVEQLNELNDDQLMKIILNPKGGYFVVREAKHEICKRLLTIGKMIEILETKGFEIKCQGLKWLVSNGEKAWQYSVLVDALWDAVKEIL